MLKDIDYIGITEDLFSIQNSDIPEDNIEYARHYGAFGFNSIAVDRLSSAGIDHRQYGDQLAHLDSMYCFSWYTTQLINNIFTNIPRGNCELGNVDEVEVVFEDYHLEQYEAGVYLNALPFIEHVKNLLGIKVFKINCNDRIAEVFEKYFPYIRVGTCKNKVTVYELIERTFNTGGSSAVLKAVKQISGRVVKVKSPTFVGTHWFSNAIFDRGRSIPMGVLINTIGNNPKNLDIMSLQYNNPKIDIEIYNKYSKNKISKVYSNDINTSLLDTIAAVSECYMYVGIQSEVSMIASALCGIPTMITASSPNIYWYILNGLNPYVNVARMRYSGDYEYITDKINKFI